MIKEVFGSHFYVWNGVIYHQKSGAPMGLRGSGPASRLLMDEWVEKTKEVEIKSKAMATINPVGYEALDIHLMHPK